MSARSFVSVGNKPTRDSNTHSAGIWGRVRLREPRLESTLLAIAYWLLEDWLMISMENTDGSPEDVCHEMVMGPVEVMVSVELLMVSP